MNRLILFSLLCAALAVLPSYTNGQYYPAPGRYANPYYPPGTGAGNALQGAAEVTRAQGDVTIANEKARILREDANQAKLDTKKKAFDLMMYEKENTPTYTEELTKEKVQIINRIMNFPLRGEITDGKTLNILLPHIEALSTYGAMGPPVPIPQSMVNELNITSGAGTSSVGMLHAGGRVDWPPALLGKNQKQLDMLLPAACDAVVAGKLTPTLMKQVRTEMKTMREVMRQQLAKDEIETSSYLQCIEFYNTLEASVNALERPDARKQLSGAYAPRARNVQELADYMTDNGLKFAPATPGNEGAYQVTHDAFVRYARTAQASSGFQAMNAPIKSPGYKK
jgi:hypothetical protein